MGFPEQAPESLCQHLRSIKLGLMEVGEELTRRGHEVTVVSPHRYKKGPISSIGSSSLSSLSLLSSFHIIIIINYIITIYITMLDIPNIKSTPWDHRHRDKVRVPGLRQQDDRRDVEFWQSPYPWLQTCQLYSYYLHTYMTWDLLLRPKTW